MVKGFVGAGVVRGEVGDFMVDIFVQKVGDGGNTRFWLDIWCTIIPHIEVFQWFYKISLQLELTIKEMEVR
jgi:hypothetical protein